MDIQAMCMRLVGDLRALILVYSVQSSTKPPTQLLPTLMQLRKNVQREVTTLEADGIISFYISFFLFENIFKKRKNNTIVNKLNILLQYIF